MSMLSNLDKHLKLREEISDREIDRRKSDRPDFLICGRVNKRPPENVLPWDRQDKCRSCGTGVWYDSRYSDLSMPHVCVECAANQVDFLRRGALNATQIREEDLNDQEQYARIVRSISQSRAGEHRK